MIDVTQHVYFKMPVSKVITNEDGRTSRVKGTTEFLGEPVTQAEDGMIFLRVMAMKVLETKKWAKVSEQMYVEICIDDVEV
jgi:hypothetical protein